MIYTVGQAPESELYTRSSFPKFLQWEEQQDEYELDIETTMTNWWCDKELVTVQLGSTDGSTQWLIHYRSLNDAGKRELKRVLENHSKRKLIHNGMFEYVVLMFHDIMIENVYDTMLADMIINGGTVSQKGESLYSLAALMMKYFQIELDKTYQTSFSHAPLTPEQIVYATDDVKYLSKIRDIQLPKLEEQGLMKVAELEFEAMLGYGDMTFNGIELNPTEWVSNLQLVEPLITESLQKLEGAVMEDARLYRKAILLGYLSESDRLQVNWNSSNQKKQILSWVAPELELVTKAAIQKFLKTNTITDEIDEILLELGDKNYEKANKYICDYFREDLIHNEYLIPAGQLTINWNSVDQVLPLIQAVEPKLKDMSADSMAKTVHPITRMIGDYKDTLKLRTTYGEKFIEKYLEPDGKIRTNYNQIVSTGRVSSGRPNMQNIPSKEELNNRYRHPFKPPRGFKLVGSDYTSQELCVIAYLSRDPVWTEALSKGQDLHSVCAEMVWPKEWKEGTQEGCAYFAPVKSEPGKVEYAKQKCSCKRHKAMRSKVKPIDFGLAYGMSEFKLAGDISVTVPEAKKLIRQYFDAFPKIEVLLNYLGRYGVKNGYIQTIAPFFRKRYFPEWHQIQDFVKEAHLSGVQYNSTLGAIERASKNCPIQGSSADMIKYALVLLRRFINSNNLRDKIKLVLQVHDENVSVATDDIAEWWAKEMTRIMEEAAYFIIPNGLLKADTSISDKWEK